MDAHGTQRVSPARRTAAVDGGRGDATGRTLRSPDSASRSDGLGTRLAARSRSTASPSAAAEFVHGRLPPTAWKPRRACSATAGKSSSRSRPNAARPCHHSRCRRRRSGFHEYRARFALKPDYPMAAPNCAQQRRESPSRLDWVGRRSRRVAGEGRPVGPSRRSRAQRRPHSQVGPLAARVYLPRA
jgi:hypothetical protein